MYLSARRAMEAGVPDTVPAMNVNACCGSGVQAIVVCNAEPDAAIASRSRLAAGREYEPAPYIMPARPLGSEMAMCSQKT